MHTFQQILKSFYWFPGDQGLPVDGTGVCTGRGGCHSADCVGVCRSTAYCFLQPDNAANGKCLNCLTLY